MKRGNTNLDFLMTSGGAVLLILLLIGLVFMLGLFDTRNYLGKRAVGLNQIGILDWRLNSAGEYIVIVRNQAGVRINVTAIDAEFENKTIENDMSFVLDPGETRELQVGTYSNRYKSGSSYSIQMKVNYKDILTEFEHTDSGTVYGKVE